MTVVQGSPGAQDDGCRPERSPCAGIWSACARVPSAAGTPCTPCSCGAPPCLRRLHKCVTSMTPSKPRSESVTPLHEAQSGGRIWASPRPCSRFVGSRYEHSCEQPASTPRPCQWNPSRYTEHRRLRRHASEDARTRHLFSNALRFAETHTHMTSNSQKYPAQPSVLLMEIKVRTLTRRLPSLSMLSTR